MSGWIRLVGLGVFVLACPGRVLLEAVLVGMLVPGARALPDIPVLVTPPVPLGRSVRVVQ